jgi:phospholipid/cholesterol/gamma-HCH transport system substrate-binding protein
MKLPSLSGLSGRNRFIATALGIVVVVFGVSAAIAFWPSQHTKHLTAYFTTATGLYTGDQVMVLGVQVGKVDSITPQAGRVRVGMEYDSSVKIPANAMAAIVTPTLVTTRYVQLTPAYTTGAVLADSGSIPQSRTAVPVEWDQIEQEMNTLATALGPNQKNSSGALNSALKVSAANLNGQGTNLHDTITALNQATSTLAANRGNLFATVDNLNTFVGVLAQANGQVDSFNKELTSVSGVLAQNKQEMATTLSTLNSSLGIVQNFVHNNRNALASNLSSLNNVTANLARSDQNLADTLQLIPTEVSNFNNIYDPQTHAITGSLDANVLEDPASFVCSTIFSLGGTPSQCKQALGPLANLARQKSLPVTVDPLNRQGYSNQTSSTGSGSSTSGSSNSGSNGGLLNLLNGGL